MKLIDRRSAAGFTQEYVAKTVCVTQEAISNYENGNYKPKYDVAKKLAELFGCTVDEIMAGFDE